MSKTDLAGKGSISSCATQILSKYPGAILSEIRTVGNCTTFHVDVGEKSLLLRKVVCANADQENEVVKQYEISKECAKLSPQVRKPLDLQRAEGTGGEVHVEMLYRRCGNDLSSMALTDINLLKIVSKTLSAFAALEANSIFFLGIKPGDLSVNDSSINITNCEPTKNTEARIKEFETIFAAEKNTGEASSVYFPPEVLNAIPCNAPEIASTFNLDKIDVYCWGMVIYQLISNKSSKILEDENALYKRDEKSYGRFLSLVKTARAGNDAIEVYARKVAPILVEALAYSPAKRPSFAQMLAQFWDTSVEGRTILSVNGHPTKNGNGKETTRPKAPQVVDKETRPEEKEKLSICFCLWLWLFAGIIMLVLLLGLTGKSYVQFAVPKGTVPREVESKTRILSPQPPQPLVTPAADSAATHEVRAQPGAEKEPAIEKQLPDKNEKPLSARESIATPSGLEQYYKEHKKMPFFSVYKRSEILRSIGENETTIIRQLASMEKYKAIYIDSAYAGDKVAQAVADIVVKQPGITALFLRGGMITNTGAKAVADAIGAPNHLLALYFIANTVNDVGVSEMARAVRRSNSLLALYLSALGATDIGIVEIANTVRICQNLLVLYLYGELVSEFGARELAYAIKSRNNLLAVYLNIPKFSNNVAKDLALAVGHNPKLMAFYLESKAITDSAAVEIAKVFQNGNLLDFYLHGWEMSGSAAKEVSSIVTKHPHIHSLYLAAGKVDSEGLKDVATSIKNSQNIARVYICGGEKLLGNDVKLIVDSLSGSDTVERVSIYAPAVTKYDLNEILQKIGSNVDLEVVLGVHCSNQDYPDSDFHNIASGYQHKFKRLDVVCWNIFSQQFADTELFAIH